jgi:hypothetical protein
MFTSKQRKLIAVAGLSVIAGGSWAVIEFYGVPKEDSILMQAKKKVVRYDDPNDPKNDPRNKKHENYGKWITDTSYLNLMQDMHEQKAKITQVESGLLNPFTVKGRTVPMMYINKRLEHYNVPGIAISVIENGDLAWFKAYGKVSEGSKTNLLSTNLFHSRKLGTFFASAVAQKLVQSEKLLLSDLIGQNTVESLLRGKSNFCGPSSTYYFDESPANFGSVFSLVGKCANGDFIGTVLALENHLKQVSGQEFHQLAKETLTYQCNMQHTIFESPLPEKFKKLATIASLQGKKVEILNSHSSMLSVWTTPQDTTTYLLELMKSYKGSNRWLNPANAENIFGGMCLGGEIRGEKDNQYFYLEDDDSNGYRTVVIAFFKTGGGCVIMSNSLNSKGLENEIIRSIANHYKWPKQFHTIEKEVKQLDNKTIKKYVGNYMNDKKEALNVVFDDKRKNTLILDTMDIIPEGNDKFFNINGTEAEFVENGCWISTESKNKQFYKKL